MKQKQTVAVEMSLKKKKKANLYNQISIIPPNDRTFPSCVARSQRLNLVTAINSGAPCGRWQLWKPLMCACRPDGTDLNTKVAVLPLLSMHTNVHTHTLSLSHTHTHTPSNTQAHAQHVCSRHPASHKPLPPNIPHIWPFNCGPKISVITESVSTLQVNTAAEIDTSTTIYKCAGARGRFLFIADWN